MVSRSAQRRAMATFQPQFGGGALPYGYSPFQQQFGSQPYGAQPYAQRGMSTMTPMQFSPAFSNPMASMGRFPMAGSNLGSMMPLAGQRMMSTGSRMMPPMPPMPQMPVQGWGNQQQMMQGSSPAITNLRQRMAQTQMQIQQWHYMAQMGGPQQGRRGGARNGKNDRKTLTTLERKLREDGRELERLIKKEQEQAMKRARGSKRRVPVGQMYGGRTNKFMYGPTY